jgi:hypothetical protein
LTLHGFGSLARIARSVPASFASQHVFVLYVYCNRHEESARLYHLLYLGTTVAHRLSTIKGTDRIIVLQDGVIAEEGSYETLMELDGVSTRLARKQMA